MTCSRDWREAHENVPDGKVKGCPRFPRFAVLCTVPDMEPGRDCMKRSFMPDRSEFVIVHENVGL